MGTRRKRGRGFARLGTVSRVRVPGLQPQPRAAQRRAKLVITNLQAIETVSPLRKAAIFLVTLGEEASAELLRLLSVEEVHRLSQEVARLGSLPSDQTEKVLEEFYKMAVARQYATHGGVDFARKLLARAFGPEESRRMIDHL